MQHRDDIAGSRIVARPEMRPDGGASDRERHHNGLAILAGLTMVAITAVQFVAARFSLRSHLTPVDISSLRFAGAGLVFLPILWRTGLEKLAALGWRRAVVLALLIGFPYPALINWGLSHAPAAHAAALCPASIIFFSFVLSRLLFKDAISPARLASIGTIILGLLAFILARSGGSGGGSTLFGDLLFIGSGVMFSTYAVLVRRWSIDAVAATAAVALLSCIPVPVVWGLVAGNMIPSGIGAVPATEIAAQVVIQGFLAGAAAIFLYTYAVRQLGAAIASLFMPCIPVATALTGAIVLGEVPSPQQWLAIAIITAGILLPMLGKALLPAGLRAK